MTFETRFQLLRKIPGSGPLANPPRKDILVLNTLLIDDELSSAAFRLARTGLAY